MVEAQHTRNVDHETSDRKQKALMLRSVIEANESESPFDVAQIDFLLHLDPSTIPSYKVLRVAAPIIFLAGYVATRTLTEKEGIHLDPLIEFNWVVHGALQSIHALSNNAALYPNLAYHLPYLFLELSGISGAAGVWDAVNKRGLSYRASEAKTALRARIDNGIQSYIMPDEHTAVFEGQGDWIADALQRRRITDVMRYASSPVNSDVWQNFDPSLGDEHLSQALKRADFQSAGEILILPTVKKHLFLPDPEKHKDMTLDEIEDLISFLDSESETNKRVIIVGSGKFTDARIDTHIQSGQVDSMQKTLMVLANELQKKRKADVKLIDPTEIVMKSIFTLAGDRPLVFSANTEGDQEYKSRFQQQVSEAIKKGDYKPRENATEVRVIYNIDDAPTRAQAKVGDIVVILDSRKRSKLLERGIPESHIICVPDLVMDAVDNAVS